MRRRFLSNEDFSSFYNFEDYLTIEALEDDLRVSFSSDIEYGIDGKGWKVLSLGREIIAKAGQLISFKGTFVPNSEIGSGRDGIGNFTINKKCRLRGNVLSLLWGDEAKGKVDLTGYKNAFAKLFLDCSSITEIDSTFLPATTLESFCYYYMFYNCTSLTTAPELPATELAPYCYGSMFRDCTALIEAPELPATTLANSCYYAMFRGCTSLVSIPELPATTLADSCYDSMFEGCTSLTTVPKLPARTLANSCYAHMFNGCKNLTTVLELPAIILTQYCYAHMFNICRKLNYIKMLATDVSATNCLWFWVDGVASSGTFVKNPCMTSLPTATSFNDYAGIPSGWTVVNDGEESGGNLITFTIDGTEYQAKEGMTWGEWVDSEYNTINANIYQDYIVVPYDGGQGAARMIYDSIYSAYVMYTQEIITNHTYIITSGGSGN